MILQSLERTFKTFYITYLNSIHKEKRIIKHSEFKSLLSGYSRGCSKTGPKGASAARTVLYMVRMRWQQVNFLLPRYHLIDSHLNPTLDLDGMS